jgi:hypothetical protein
LVAGTPEEFDGDPIGDPSLEPTVLKIEPADLHGSRRGSGFAGLERESERGSAP